MPLVVLLACTAATPDSAPLKGGDTCTILADGTWTFSGDAFGMGDQSMTGVVTLDAAACVFTLDQWSMQMEDLPNGGALDGDAVTLDGLTSRWRSCTGTATDERTASGSCASDGSDWKMVAN